VAGSELDVRRDLSEAILVTGGCGFIGANFVRNWLQAVGTPVVNLDKLTYAGHLLSVADLTEDPNYSFVEGDIGDRALVQRLLNEYAPRAIVHLAAESHVDRSIRGPRAFVETNVLGTFVLLDATRVWLERLDPAARESFRFLHVSTDEVYGSLAPGDPPFREDTPYAPNSPYSASKAAADHLVRAYVHTYGLPAIITNCSNNYGPYQLPEKLIPLMIHQAIEGRPLPVYGDGQQMRDWLYVSDHCAALRLVLERGRTGEVYNIGGGSSGDDGAWPQITNLDLVRTLCALLDELAPRPEPYAGLIRFVEDRPGHDRRYAVDWGKLHRELGWTPGMNLESGLRKTVEWYLANEHWVSSVMATRS
jgi:dTDP-glucose 4,6-dehydratase